ncbi:acylneuraminate cytidylyltransferase family protein [Alphaproteobacteria bacterium]|nr:acylneuraminate cytidylyltransferase family protein [Alphaproteobacteria bacterium]
MNIICVIGARGGSKGLPNKNIKLLLGKPLIAWSIETALLVSEISKVIVSTDDKEIAKISLEYGAEVPFIRPPDLSGSEVGKFDVWKHALKNSENYYKTKFDMLVDLDCTNPLRDVSDIKECINKLQKRKLLGVDTVFTICNSRKNPYFNMVEYDVSGKLCLSKKLEDKILTRQKAPAVYDHVASIYAILTSQVKNGDSLLSGFAEGYDIGERKSFDIDSEFDFELVEFLMKKKINNHK